MTEQIKMVAERIRGLRELNDISVEEMSGITNTSVDEYLQHEQGERDFSFTFLYNVARVFNMDIIELMTGEMPRLKQFSLIRDGEGLPIQRRKGFSYQHLAYLFKDKQAEPFKVVAKYDKDAENAEIALNTHSGQEMNYIIEGKLKIQIDGHVMVMHPGDCIYYNAKRPHGMVALEKDCIFLAVIINTERGG